MTEGAVTVRGGSRRWSSSGVRRKKSAAGTARVRSTGPGKEGSFVDGADLLVDGGALAMHEP